MSLVRTPRAFGRSMARCGASAGAASDTSQPPLRSTRRKTRGRRLGAWVSLPLGTSQQRRRDREPRRRSPLRRRSQSRQTLPCGPGRAGPDAGTAPRRMPVRQATSYSRATVPVFGYTLCLVSFNVARSAASGSSGMPLPRSTGIIATSTVSTSPMPSGLLKSDPPPNNQMSLPGAAFSFATVSLALSETVTPGQSDCRNVRDSARTAKEARCLALLGRFRYTNRNVDDLLGRSDLSKDLHLPLERFGTRLWRWCRCRPAWPVTHGSSPPYLEYTLN